MAQYEALRSFGGKVSATKGSTIEIEDKKVAKDLLTAGYIKAVGSKAAENKADEKKAKAAAEAEAKAAAEAAAEAEAEVSNNTETSEQDAQEAEKTK